MFDFYLLRYFLAVVEAGSFTRAAERECVTQPTLSAGIKKLEGQLGAQLFERNNRRIFLTEMGVRFLPRARSILHECNMALQSVAEDGRQAVLKIGLLSTIANRLAGQVLAAFKTEHPRCTLEIIDGTEHELHNRLEDHSLDFALALQREGLRFHQSALMSERYVFILANDHPLANRSALQASDLAKEPMIVRSRCEVLSETSRYFTDHNVRPRLVYRTSNDGRAIALTAAGLGGTVVPESSVDDRVVARRLEGFPYRRTLALLRRAPESGQSLPAFHDLFEGSLVQHFA